MKIIILIAVLQLFNNFKVVCGLRTEMQSFTSKAIAEIVVELAKSSGSVNIITHWNKSSSNKEVYDAVLQRISESGVTKVLQDIEPWNYKLNTSTLLMFDSPQSFQEIAPKIVWQTDPQECHKHLVSAAGLTFKDVETFLSSAGVTEIGCVNFLVDENKKSIDIAQQAMFSAQACRESTLTIVNRFEKSTMRWRHSDFYPKYQNLHGCPLVVAYVNGLNSPAIKSAIEIMSIVRNFTIVRKECKFNSDNIVPFRFDFIESFHESREENIAHSIPLNFETIFIIIPPGESYNQFEKMFMMFEYEVWLAIAITLCAAFCTIFLLNLLPKSLKEIIMGSNITSPGLNLISTFLVGGQHQLPRRSFARFLLLLFILFSMIIRTCHQSLLFKLLQADLRKPRLQTYHELQEKNFTFYGSEPFRIGGVP